MRIVAAPPTCKPTIETAMMPVAATEPKGDGKDWVVERCKLHLNKNDRYTAKAWILTARSLFPDDFAVQVRFI